MSGLPARIIVTQFGIQLQRPGDPMRLASRFQARNVAAFSACC
jgi:hypothetical protein